MFCNSFGGYLGHMVAIFLQARKGIQQTKVDGSMQQLPPPMLDLGRLLCYEDVPGMLVMQGPFGLTDRGCTPSIFIKCTNLLTLLPSLLSYTDPKNTPRFARRNKCQGIRVIGHWLPGFYENSLITGRSLWFQGARVPGGWSQGCQGVDVVKSWSLGIQAEFEEASPMSPVGLPPNLSDYPPKFDLRT